MPERTEPGRARAAILPRGCGKAEERCGHGVECGAGDARKGEERHDGGQDQHAPERDDAVAGALQLWKSKV